MAKANSKGWFTMDEVLNILLRSEREASDNPILVDSEEELLFKEGRDPVLDRWVI